MKFFDAHDAVQWRDLMPVQFFLARPVRRGPPGRQSAGRFFHGRNKGVDEPLQLRDHFFGPLFVISVDSL